MRVRVRACACVRVCAWVYVRSVCSGQGRFALHGCVYRIWMCVCVRACVFVGIRAQCVHESDVRCWTEVSACIRQMLVLPYLARDSN